MRLKYLILFFFLAFEKNYGQSKPNNTITVIDVPDFNKLKEEDIENDANKAQPWRFGVNNPVDISPNTAVNQWQQDGYVYWKHKIVAPGAKSLNFHFNEFQLSEHAVLTIYNENKKQILGPYTFRENNSFHEFSTGIILDSLVYIELKEPEAIKSSLHLDQVTYGYRGFQKSSFGFGQSGNCNVNVVCPEGNDWQEQINSVALIVVNGAYGCTGSLINNTCENGTPYLLTANHCLDNDLDVSSWAFLFNWESPTCANSVEGPINQSISGATLLAHSSSTDFALLELSSAPPEIYEPYYGGWDRSGNIPLNETVIHHPRGDVKKITFDYDPANISANFWHVNDYDVGTTEGGSSGSPLFNQDKRVIGQLFGGPASCSNDDYDEYGRFDLSWDHNPSQTEQLKYWLDACGTNALILDGFDPFSANSFQNDASVIGVLNMNQRICTPTIQPKLIIKNKGTDSLVSLTISYSTSNTTDQYLWTGLLHQNEVDTITLAPFNTGLFGVDTLKFILSDPNGQVDEYLNNNKISYAFYSFENPVDLKFTLQTDRTGSEVSWDIKDSSGFLYYFGGGYADEQNGETIVNHFCLTKDSCYIFTIHDSYGDGLSYDTGYYMVQNSLNDTLIHLLQLDYGYHEIQNFCAIDSNFVISVEEYTKIDEITLYPNPSAGLLFVKGLDAFNTMTIYNQLGEKMEVLSISKNLLDLRKWPSGIYFVTFKGKNEVIYTKKLVLVKN